MDSNKIEIVYGDQCIQGILFRYGNNKIASTMDNKEEFQNILTPKTIELILKILNLKLLQY